MHGVESDALDLLFQLVRHEGHSSSPVVELTSYLFLQFSSYACIFKHFQKWRFNDLEHFALFVGVVKVGEFLLEGKRDRGLCDFGDGSRGFFAGAEKIFDDTE